MMQHMMSCMHAQSGMQMPGMMMPGMQTPETQMPGMQTPETQMPGMQMPGMMPGQDTGGHGPPGAGADPATGASMPQSDCAECSSRSGLAALLGRPIAGLTLSTDQQAELDAIVTRARTDALAVLSAEQRAALEAQAAVPGGMCMAAPPTSAAPPQD
jgi:hypothetical protein